jgi:TonB family protein
MNAANFLAYSAQVALLVAACAALPRLLGLRSPGVQYAFWRTVLVVCLALPFVQPWRPAVMVFVPAPSASPVVGAGAPPVAAPLAAADLSAFDWIAAAQWLLLAGVAVRLLWLAAGVLRLRALRRRSAGQESSAFADLQRAVGVRARILWSAEVHHPVTFGVLAPVVLLPAALKAVDLAAQHAVVAHELSHVKRRDWLWVLGEEIVRSVFWFHPAIWWLVSRIQLARETVVDELSILVTNARRTYLETLLAFADDAGLASSSAFSARRHLFHRVMLLSKEDGMSSTRVAIASSVLVLALGTGTWGAMTAFPLHGPDVQSQTPPRDPLTPDAHHRVAQQYWDKANKDTTLTAAQKLDVIAKGIAADDRALAMNPDYVPALTYKGLFLRMRAALTEDAHEREVLLRQADELRDKVAALRGPTMPPPPPPAPGSEMTEEYKQALARLNPIRIGGGIAPPAKVRDVKPVYPDEARASGVQGVVIIEALIDTDGSVADARILRSVPMLNDAALTAVRQWKFRPTLLNGTPQSVVMTVTVNFTLN